MAHCIARPAARRARMIMAMRATCKRAAALAARGYEMPQGGMIRSNSQSELLKPLENVNEINFRASSGGGFYTEPERDI